MVRRRSLPRAQRLSDYVALAHRVRTARRDLVAFVLRPADAAHLAAVLPDARDRVLRISGIAPDAIRVRLARTHTDDARAPAGVPDAVWQLLVGEVRVSGREHARALV